MSRPQPPSTPGRTRARAVLAFAVPSALALALSLGLPGGPAGAAPPQRDTGAQVTGPGRTDVEELRVGDCFNTEDDLTKDETEAAGSVRIVPCGQAHEGEVYAVSNLTGGPYPGEQKVTRMADEKCSDKALTDYVGAGAKLDGYSDYSYYPSADTWARGDREVTCFLGDPKSPRTGSVRASGS
ncbi:septum formation family protein [Streptomyces sp. NPDC007369]|uniref:septum formation family protein n=1 Tax=Streptomyces sp. NPDC007369 TaxID=3154589 RepID=UPI0033C0BC63